MRRQPFQCEEIIVSLSTKRLNEVYRESSVTNPVVSSFLIKKLHRFLAGSLKNRRRVLEKRTLFTGKFDTFSKVFGKLQICQG